MEIKPVMTPVYGINQEVCAIDNRGRITTSVITKIEATEQQIKYTCANGYQYNQDYIYHDRYEAICGFVRHNQGDMNLKVVKVKAK